LNLESLDFRVLFGTENAINRLTNQI